MPQADNVVVPDNLAQPLNISTQIFSANGFDGGGMADGGAWLGMQNTVTGGTQGVMNEPLQPVAPGVMAEPLQPVAPGVTMEPLPPVMPMSLTTNNTSPKKKPNKWVIIGIVAVVLSLALAIVSVVVTSGPRGGGDAAISDEDVLQEKVSFNIYANYLTSGESNEQDVTEDVLADIPFYADFMTEAKNEGAEIYIADLNNLFSNFSQSYLGDYDITTINDYYNIPVVIEEFTGDELLAMYLGMGKSGATIFLNNSLDIDTNEYSASMVEYARTVGRSELAILDYYAMIDGGGCLNGSEIDEACAVGVAGLDAVAENIATMALDVIETKDSFYSYAMGILRDVYAEIYSDAEEEL